MTLKKPRTLADRIDQKVFDAIYSRALVYNTCWEDPAVDRLALDKRDNFTALKAGLADRVRLHTCTVTELLQTSTEPISKFVLLDHMDWMSSYYPEALAEEWSCILDRATANARIIFRSAHAEPAYLEGLELGAERTRLSERVEFHRELAAGLQRLDRVHTYAGFHVADLRT